MHSWHTITQFLLVGEIKQFCKFCVEPEYVQRMAFSLNNDVQK